MNATISLDLDPIVLERAEQEARRRRTTVAEIVTRQLEVMAHNWQESEAGRTPITDELRGVVSLPPGFNEQQEAVEQLSRKHGI